MKWEILFGGLFYAAPFMGLLLPIMIDNKPFSDLSTLAMGLFFAFWCNGMGLMRIQSLEDEVKELKKKLNINE